MTDSGATPPVVTEPTQAPEKDAAKVSDDKPLGAAGEKALREERDARKALEQQLKDLRAGLSGLAGTDAKSDADPVATLAQRLDSLERRGRIDAVARANGITDEGDIKLLESATDEETLALLVERLKANPKPNAPAPDPTQGGGGAAPLALNGDGLEQALRSALGI